MWVFAASDLCHKACHSTLSTSEVTALVLNLHYLLLLKLSPSLTFQQPFAFVLLLAACSSPCVFSSDVLVLFLLIYKHNSFGAVHSLCDINPLLHSPTHTLSCRFLCLGVPCYAEILYYYQVKFIGFFFLWSVGFVISFWNIFIPRVKTTDA